MNVVVRCALGAALLTTPAFAGDAPKSDARAAELERQVKSLQEQIQRADAVIGALSRQRNEAMDRAVLMETRAIAVEAARQGRTEKVTSDREEVEDARFNRERVLGARRPHC